MRISSITQTPFVSHDEKNMVNIEVTDYDYCNPYFVEFIVEERVVYKQKIFAQRFSALIPCFEKENVCTVRITPFEAIPIEKDFTLKPPKHWEVPIVYSSHEDLGYCAYVDKLHYECYEYLKIAMSLCEKYDGFRYMIEHYWWLDAFDCYASNEEKEQLKVLLMDKKIELNAIHSGVHTPWQNSEQLVRSQYFPCIYGKEKYGAETLSAFYTDISGITWAAVEAYAKMGIKYMGVFANDARNISYPRDISSFFWLKSHTGEEKVLFWYHAFYRPRGLLDAWCDTKRQYNEGEYYFDATKSLKTEAWFTEKMSEMDESPCDIFPVCFYDDRETPTSMLITVCEEMNKKWKYPHFKMEIPSVIMSEMEERFGEYIPVLSGEVADQWSDFATISPHYTSKKRELAHKLHNAEMLSSFFNVTSNDSYEKDKFDKVMWGMCGFDEHCWATSSKNPQAMHRYNLEKVKMTPINDSYSDIAEIINGFCGRPES